jgi:hypothetical protein
MSYCVNPLCSSPQNPNKVDFCQNCGSGLLLNNRFCAARLIGEGGFSKTFQAVDKHSLHESTCLLKQFYPQNSAQILKSRINIQTKTIIPGQQSIKKIAKYTS